MKFVRRIFFICENFSRWKLQEYDKLFFVKCRVYQALFVFFFLSKRTSYVRDKDKNKKTEFSFSVKKLILLQWKKFIVQTSSSLLF